MHGVHPDSGLIHGVVHPMAFGVAELALGAGAPGLQGQGLLIFLHEVEEADAAAGQALCLIERGPQDLLEGGAGGHLGNAGTGGQDGFGELLAGDIIKADEHAALG